MAAAKKQKIKTKQLRKGTRPYKYSKAKDEQMRDGMRDTTHIYQITKKELKKTEKKTVSVEDVAAGLLAL
ncbi:unnamed protein product [Rhizoctonia solani]|uniref:Uncharacterized protein n=1 Tax=Rhizoctonia solani TaxID=456999 RepID=A0A8H3A293_9AGAM|nr:unnamed protein product [Rhizoctonia solani]